MYQIHILPDFGFCGIPLNRSRYSVIRIIIQYDPFKHFLGKTTNDAISSIPIWTWKLLNKIQLCLKKYFVWILSKILFVIPLVWLKWILVMIGMALSGTVLVFTLWPSIREDKKQVHTVHVVNFDTNHCKRLHVIHGQHAILYSDSFTKLGRQLQLLAPSFLWEIQIQCS